MSGVFRRPFMIPRIRLSESLHPLNIAHRPGAVSNRFVGAVEAESRDPVSAWGRMNPVGFLPRHRTWTEEHIHRSVLVLLQVLVGVDFDRRRFTNERCSLEVVDGHRP